METAGNEEEEADASGAGNATKDAYDDYCCRRKNNEE